MNENHLNQSKVVRVVRVRFPDQTLPGTFRLGRLEVKHGQEVVALSERGMRVGLVNSAPFEVPYSEDMPEIPRISKIATPLDREKAKELLREQKKARGIFERQVKEQNLPMNLVDVEFVSFGKKVLITYTAPDRVDFRELLLTLKSEIKTQIELRQVSKEKMNEIGPCGPDLCLYINSFLDNGQPRKRCNEYHCCLEHKDPFYEERRERLPKVSDYVCTYSGDMGRVERIDLWKEEFELLTDQGQLRRYVCDQWKETLERKTVKFPKSFETVLNETMSVIGSEEKSIRRAKDAEEESRKNQEAAKSFAEKKFEELFGCKTFGNKL